MLKSEVRAAGLDGGRGKLVGLSHLAICFDTNGDGKLTAADANFAKFKLMVTNANGSTSVVTLASLGIVELDLTPDSTRIEFADGSVVQAMRSGPLAPTE